MTDPFQNTNIQPTGFSKLKVKLYFPFSYETSKNLLEEKKSPFAKIDHIQKEWKLIQLENKNFLESMDSKFFRTDQGDNASLIILKSFELKSDFRNKHYLLDDLSEDYKYFIVHADKKRREYSLHIHEIYLHFFESGIGFLEVNLHFDPQENKTFYDFVQLLYRLKELRNSEHPLNQRDPQKKVEHGFITDGEVSQRSFLDVIESLLYNSFTYPSTFLPFKTNDGKSFASHTYTYLYMQDEQPTPSQLEYALSYGPDLQSVQYKIEPTKTFEYQKTFKTIYFNFTENGGILFVHKPEYDRGLFFESPSGLIDSWKKDYSLSYLYLLHQRYSLIEYGILSTKLMLNIETLMKKHSLNKDNDTNKTLDTISKTLIEVLKDYHRYMIRTDIVVASKHHHINKIYHYIKRQLKIQELIDDLDHKMDHYQSYAEQVKEETAIANRQVLEKFRKKLTIVLTALSAFNAFFALGLTIAQAAIQTSLVSTVVTILLTFVTYLIIRGWIK